jgi:hypothetical protein
MLYAAQRTSTPKSPRAMVMPSAAARIASKFRAAIADSIFAKTCE